MVSVKGVVTLSSVVLVCISDILVIVYMLNSVYF